MSRRRKKVHSSGKPWSRIDQALRVADLLLQGGGFSAIVLDMCSIAPQDALRIPLATWFRYRAAAERTQASFLLLTQHPCAKSSAELLLRLEAGGGVHHEGSTVLARIGALNEVDEIAHRRDALWQMERAGKREGPLFRQRSEWLRDSSKTLPLRQMNVEERLVADYAGTDLTIDKHPMYYRRIELHRQGILSAEELRNCRDGEFVRTAGCVIARQRPGTAKGFIFISMEDETGIANIIVSPNLYERNRLVLTRSKFLVVGGSLQNKDSVIHVRAVQLIALADGALEMKSPDFH
ncbi:MAG: error-prone polymerase [Acidobacteriaceae bacterium]|nr:error-prone polymerase [Acidobacteriaceae bacterium]